MPTVACSRRLLDRVEASFEFGHTAVQWIDATEPDRDVMHAHAHTVENPGDNATREVYELAKDVFADVSKPRDRITLLRFRPSHRRRR